MSNIKSGVRQLVVSSDDLPGGKFRFYVGETLNTRVDGEVREALGGLTGIVGSHSTFEPCHIEAEIIVNNELDLKALMRARDNTVTAVWANGQTDQIWGAWLVTCPERLADGKATVRWEAPSGNGQTLGIQR